MNRFSRNLLLVSLFTIIISKNAHAQNDFEGWIFEVGANITDIRNPDDKLLVNDYLGQTEWFDNMLVRLSAERILNYKSSVLLGITTANLKTVYGKLDSEDNPLAYFSVDLSYKYHIVGISPLYRLRPFIMAGTSFQSVSETEIMNKFGVGDGDGTSSQVVFHLGYGAQYWISDVVGINFQSMYKLHFGGYADVFQHSLGVIIRAVPGGYRSPRRIFD